MILKFLKKRRVKRMLWTVGILLIFGLGILLYANYKVGAYKKFVYSDLGKIPANEYGLVLGTAKIVQGKYLNQYFIKRMDAAAKLYGAGKVKKLILSGDNRRADYNEPESTIKRPMESIFAAISSEKVKKLSGFGWQTRFSFPCRQLPVKYGTLHE